MANDEIMLRIDNVSKVYKLGEIGGTTLRDEIKRVKAKILNKEDPTKKIGSKNYNKGEKFNALDNISFEVKKGERIGIIGHNGAGKSTLLKLISRVTGPSSGTIYLNGRVASMLEVGTGFHPELTGRENVYMNGAILGMTKKEIDAKIEEIIEFSEVRQFIDTPVKRYSSGMYVKLAFSVAAHLDSEIMIMDEVLAVGDMQFQKKCINKMMSVSNEEERTILYVSHNMKTIRDLCDRVVVLDRGHIIYDGDVEEGISTYLGASSGEFLCDLDTSNFKRPSDFHGNLLKIMHFSWVDKINGIFVAEKQMVFELSVYAKKSLSNLCILASVVSDTGIVVGTAQLTKKTFALSEGENNPRFCFDISNIKNGIYHLTIDIFEINSKMQFLSYDHLEHFLSFKIQKELSNETIEMKTSYFGHISLANISIIDNKESTNDKVAD